MSSTKAPCTIARWIMRCLVDCDVEASTKVSTHECRQSCKIRAFWSQTFERVSIRDIGSGLQFVIVADS